MRITQSFLNNMVRINSDRASAAVVKTSAKLSALSAVEQPSDDPVVAQRLNQLNKFDSRLERLAGNRTRVETDLKTADGVLGSMHEMLVRAKELALSMNNDTLNAQDRANGAQEAEGLLNQMMSLVNQRYDGEKYLFTGRAENRPPQAAAGFKGDDGARFVEVGPGAKIEATLSGSTVFGSGNEVIKSLSDLIDALKGTPGNIGLGQTLDDLDFARQTVLLARTEVGSRLNQLSEIASVSDDVKTNIGLEKANLMGVDVAKLAPELTSAQTMLQTVVETSKQLMARVGHAWMS